MPGATIFGDMRRVVREAANDPVVRAAGASLLAARRVRKVGLRAAFSDQRASMYARSAWGDATHGWRAWQRSQTKRSRTRVRAIALGVTLVGVATGIVKSRRDFNARLQRYMWL